MSKWSLILSGLTALIVGCAAGQKGYAPLETVDNVDLTRYMGQWYEIASYPAWFQKGCTASTAYYELLPDGKVSVVNRCQTDDPDNKVKEARGKAQVVDPSTNAKLKVWFFWPFKGDYWIIDLDEDYQWSVVGEPKREYLWILSRNPDMDEHIYADIISRLQGKGYDPAKLNKSLHKE